MSHYGTLRNYPISEAAEEIRGAKLYGLNDEKLGKIDDVIFDHSTGLIRYVVVDTGGWLKTKKFIVPADDPQIPMQTVGWMEEGCRSSGRWPSFECCRACRRS